MLDDGWTDRWMNPGQGHLLAPDPGHSKEAPWWQVGVWAQEELWLTPPPVRFGGDNRRPFQPGFGSWLHPSQLCDLGPVV